MHAVKVRRKSANLGKQSLDTPLEEEPVSDELASKPLSQTLVDLQLEAGDRENISEDRKYLHV